MDSAPPDDAAHAREPLIVAGGRSIELGAVVARLTHSGIRVVPLSCAEDFEHARSLAPDLLLWDLAAVGSLGWLGSLLVAPRSNGDEHPPPELIALGTPPEEARGDAELLLTRAVHHFRRPLDIQAVAEAVRMQLFRPKSVAPPSKSPSFSPVGVPRVSLPAVSNEAEVSGAASTSLPPEEVGAASRHLSASGSEHSVVSPELMSLLAEAESRVEAQIALEAHQNEHAPPLERDLEELGEEVWAALAEPLEDDADLLGADALESSRLPSAIDPPSSPPVEVGTMPPEPSAPLDEEDTGSHAAEPDAETSGSVAPKTSTGVAAAPQTTRAGPTRQPTPGGELPETLPPADALASRGGGDAAAPSTRALDAAGAEPAPSSNELGAMTKGPLDRPPVSELTRGDGWRARRNDDGASLEALSPAADGEPRPTSLPPRASVTAFNEESEPPRTLEPREEPPVSLPPNTTPLALPTALVLGASLQVLGQAVRRRFSGCMAFEVDQGLRRIILKDGDIVIAASAVHGESLVSYLAQRGDLTTEAANQIEHRIPNYGRHAGAALIARGLLEQGELWPVLRAHAEWVLGRILLIERGTVREESPVPERLAAEPAVFGGATGAEVIVEAVQRALKPDQALSLLGGLEVSLSPGEASELLGECALPAELAKQLGRQEPRRLGALLRELPHEPMLPSLIQALVALGVLTVTRGQRAPSRAAPLDLDPAAAPRLAPARDALDDEALRLKVKARRALVDEGDYFALLGVPREATGYDIRRSYLELRRQFDPARVLRPNTLDLREDVDAIVHVLDEAYEILRDQGRRERYRRAIESSP